MVRKTERELELSKTNANRIVYWAVPIIGTLIVIAVLFLTMFLWAHFKLWRAEYTGQAFEIEKEYIGKGIKAEAEYSKQARIAQAEAERDSASLTAEAISIVGEAAKKYPEYRQQEFFLSLGESLREGKVEQIIYLPTEAGLPLTEARNRN